MRVRFSQGLPMSNEEFLEALNSAIEEFNEFDSDDGGHHVKWEQWYDEENDITYPAWVCSTHSKLYYRTCAIAQID